MARRSKNTTSQRDFSTQSLDTLLTFRLRPPPVLLPVALSPPVSQVLEAGDRRLFQPDRSTRPPHTVKAGASRVVAGRSLSATRFADPAFVAICRRRTIRREVLFAIKKTRAGARAPKRKNFWSDVSCSPR